MRSWDLEHLGISGPWDLGTLGSRDIGISGSHALGISRSLSSIRIYTILACFASLHPQAHIIPVVILISAIAQNLQQSQGAEMVSGIFCGPDDQGVTIIKWLWTPSLVKYMLIFTCSLVVLLLSTIFSALQQSRLKITFSFPCILIYLLPWPVNV